MKRIILSLFIFSFACVCVSQTVISRSYTIKNTGIIWSLAGSDTIYTVPVTDFTTSIPETIFLRFKGSGALLSTFKWLSTAEIADGELVQLDFTMDKNVISRFSKNFSSGFMLFNKDYELPSSVFWMKKLIIGDYKRLLKYFSNGKRDEKEKPKSIPNDDMYY